MDVSGIKDKVLILDFGSQVTQLIARRIREQGVYSEIRGYKTTIEDIKQFAPKAIILSGGPSSVLDENSPTISQEVFDLNIPILGICYGQQLICNLLGGKVEKSQKREFGNAAISIVESSPLFKDLWTNGSKYNVWMSHGDRVVDIPPGFKVIADTEHTPFAAIANEQRKIYAVQFHPEVTHTEGGTKLLRNFTDLIANCDHSWTMSSFVDKAIAEIREKVGDKKVICAVSGGVDSSVVAALLNKAIGKQLTCIFVNTGLLRKNEAEQVKTIFTQLGINLNYIDASAIFIEKLRGVVDPEQKRKIIGGLFIDIFEEQSAALGEVDFLAQGTLYSDVIESSIMQDTASTTIKSHHNVGGLPERMKLKLIEPLRELFKDEVRELGRQLGIPESIISRHPFPGPGLAVRIIGEITQEKISILQEVDDIYIRCLHENDLYDQIWQAFAVLLPIKTVGVMGDGRSYEYVCALRAVNSFDGMTADIYGFKPEFLRFVSGKIVNEVKGVNRIVYDITSKPPGTIEWE